MLRELSHYEITGKIGTGGMGIVYRATDTALQRAVAIKILRTDAGPEVERRFQQEARAASALNHPNIAHIYEVGEASGVRFIAMEYVDGVPLDAKISGRPMPVAEILDLGIQITHGLREAHSRKIVHRDIKPSNILITTRLEVKIVDFGLAKFTATADDSRLSEIVTRAFTTPGLVMGTVRYMSPEQALGQPTDPRTDLFSLGAVLYEMATGKPRFEGATPTETIDNILHGPLESAGRLNPAVPQTLDDVIGKCLERDRDRRYQTADELLEDLERLRNEEGAAGSARGRAQRFWRRHRQRIAAAMTIAALLSAGAWWVRRTRSVPASGGDEASIAVLPFADMSAEKNQEYFSDGLAEELLNELTAVPGLRVVARTSSFQFKGKNGDIRSIAKRLKVATILQGSVRRQGKTTRISVQIVKASDGFQLWAKTFDREMDDIFAVQNEVARAVTSVLSQKLLPVSALARSTNPEVYDAYLQARFFARMSDKENLEKAVSLYQRVTKLDPAYAPAWAGLGKVRINQASYGFVPLEEGFREASGAVARALELDPDQGDAHEATGLIRELHDWDWDGANRSFQRALELLPGAASALANAAMLAELTGRMDESFTLNRRAIHSDPLHPSFYLNYGSALLYVGMYEEAEAAYRQALELTPIMANAHLNIAVSYLARSRPQEALDEAEREPLPHFRLLGTAIAYHALGQPKESDARLSELIANYKSEAQFQIAEAYAFLGEADKAFAWLDRAYTERDPGLAFMKIDLLLKNLRNDPRYIALLTRMHLPH